QDGVSGYSRTVSGNQTVNGVSTKVVLQSPGGGQSFLTNDSSGIRQHGAFSPSVLDARCVGNVSEMDVYSPPVTFSLPNAYSGQSPNVGRHSGLRDNHRSANRRGGRRIQHKRGELDDNVRDHRKRSGSSGARIGIL